MPIETCLENLREESQPSIPLAPGLCSCSCNRYESKCVALRATPRHLGFIQTECHCQLLNWIKSALKIIIWQEVRDETFSIGQKGGNKSDG